MPQSTFSDTATNEQSSSTGRFKPLVSLYRHKGLAILLFFLVSLAGLPIAWIKGKPAYETSATVLVSPKFTPNLEEKGLDLRGNDYNLYIAEQQGMIRRDDIIRNVLQDPKIKAIWERPDDVIRYPENPERASVERLQMAISTKNKRGSPYIVVTIEGSAKDGLAMTLNNLIDLYLQRSQAENFFDSGGRIEALNTRKDKLQALINKKQQERTQIAELLGVTTFQEDSLNPYDKILIDATSDFKVVQRHRAEAQAQLKTLTEGEKGQITLDTMVREMVANDSVLTSFKAKLIERRTELSNQILGLTPQHPSRQRIERELEKIDQDIAQATKALYQDIRERLLDKHKAELYQATVIENAIAEELKNQQDHATRYATRYNKALVLTKDIERAYRQIDTIDNRVDFLTLESEAPGYTRWYARAKTPLYPSSPGRRKIFLVFIVMAIGLGVSAPLLIDLLDRRIQTPAEVKKILGFAPLAWILERKDFASRQLTIDQMRRLALALDRDWHNHDTSFFAITSVKAGGGTTTLALELAHHLATLGVRTLALEMNAFKPDPRYRGDIPGLGLTFLLNQKMITKDMVDTAIVPAEAELPDRLSVGEIAQRHLETSGRLLPLLKQLNKLYDLIILDSPPILLSADAELLGKIEGGILLVVEAGHTTPGELKRATTLLEHLAPPVVAAVVNRVHIYHGGGYFAELLKEYNLGTRLRRSWFKRWLWK
jgi:Mrp family chromosome partitioning ATPase